MAAILRWVPYFVILFQFSILLCLYYINNSRYIEVSWYMQLLKTPKQDE